jgi:transmembrane sensor
MPDHSQDRESKLISEAAADWFVCLRNGNVTARDRRRYVRWLKQSPAHVAEMLQLSSLDCRLRSADLDGILLRRDEIDRARGSNVINWAFRQAPRTQQSPEVASQRPIGRGHWKPVAAISALMLCLLLGTVAKFAWFDEIIETAAGEWRHFTLADGSIARVGPRSRLRVEFGDRQRAIYLSRGEAVFHVAKDTVRPFLVNAEWAVVRAVGTEFGVARQNDKVIVTVAEGSVDVSQGHRVLPLSNHEHDFPVAVSDDSSAGTKDAPQEQSIAVSAGEQVSISGEWPVTVHRVDSTRELAWAQGKLIFRNDTTLAQAVEQFNRRNRVQIEVEDPELASSLVCCIFSADDPESFALSVATKQDVTLLRDGLHRLRLVVIVQPKLI